MNELWDKEHYSPPSLPPISHSRVVHVCYMCRMCKALMPGDEESMSDEAIWETLRVRLYICNSFNFHVLIFFYIILMEDILSDCNCCLSRFKILWCLVCYCRQGLGLQFFLIGMFNVETVEAWLHWECFSFCLL